MVKVLVVDDCSVTRDLLKKLLKRLDINRVDEASDGVEAIEMYDKFQPEIVFMDIAMPNVNGIEAMKVINEKYNHTNIIMITSFDDQNFIYEALSSGAKGFVVKPFNEDKIKSALSAIISFI